MKRLKLLAFATVLALVAYSQPAEVSIPGSRSHHFVSKMVKDQEYVLQISLPAGYAGSSRKYPVIYLMDAQWDFPLLTALYGEQYFDGFIPEAIIVGITWGGAHPNPDSLRARDYTPTNDGRILQSGGADKFLEVIKSEIFPFVENNYRVKPDDNTLTGCSLGGLFTLYTLFTHPGLFNRYIAASPAFTWNNNVLSKYEEQYHHRASDKPATLFMCIGAVEPTVPGFKSLVSTLSDRKYAHLKLESRILENTGHSGTKGEGYARGLQFVFKRDSLQLPASKLNQYTGTYKMKDGTTIAIKTDDHALSLSVMNNTFTLISASETDFYLTSAFFKIHFVKDDTGKLSGFQLDRYGSSVFADKMK